MTVAVETEMLTLADLVESLGDVPLRRVRLKPTPGTASEADLFEVMRRTGRLFELVDGTLVEKAMGYYQSRLAVVLVYFLETYFEAHDIAFALGADATIRTLPRQVRMPDVGIYLWDRFPGRVLPDVNVLELCPDIAVEVLSDGNTPREMERKRQEYFGSGARRVWELDPERRRLRVYRSVDDFVELGETDTLDGEDVLPGFALPVARWFDRANRGARAG